MLGRMSRNGVRKISTRKLLKQNLLQIKRRTKLYKEPRKFSMTVLPGTRGPCHDLSGAMSAKVQGYKIDPLGEIFSVRFLSSRIFLC